MSYQTNQTNRPVWMERPSAPLTVLKIIVLTVVTTIVLLPFLVVVSTSLSTQASITRAGGLAVIPTELSVDAYTEILSGGVITRAVG